MAHKDPEPPPRPLRVAAKLVGIFAAIYFGLFGASLWSGALLQTERAMAATALELLGRFGDPQLRRHVEVSLMGTQVAYDFSLSAPGGSQRAKAKHPFHAHNLVLFAALVLASPGLVPRRRAAALVLGLAMIFAIDCGIVAGDLLSMEDQKFDVAGDANVWPSLRSVTSALRYSQPTGGAFMAPVFLWGLLLVTARERSA